MSRIFDQYARHLARFANSFFYPLKPANYLELVTPLWNYANIHARIEDIIPETKSTVTLVLKPGKGWQRHRAGQHVRIGVSIEGKRHVRTYSISSDPGRDDGLITITVKAQGRVSNYLMQHTKPGFYLSISQPSGDFVLPAKIPEKILFITGGSGITPVMSILRTLGSSKHHVDIVHIHYEKTRDDVIFRDELVDLKNKVSSYSLIRIYTRDRATLQSSNIRISAENISNFCHDWTKRVSFVCGPEKLLDEAEQIWAHAGISEKLNSERFQAKKAPADANAAGGKVRFVVSHFVAQADGSTPLLKVAEAAGLNPAHGCRMGICHGCDAVLRSGEVRDLRTGTKISCHDNVRVQLCVSAAAGDVDLEI